MPIVLIHSLAPADPNAVAQMIVEVRDSGARALACAPSNVWVMFHQLPPGRYLQGDGAPADQPQQETHPPVVLVKIQAGRQKAQRDAFTAAVVAAVARGLSVPADNVWLHWDEMQPEDVWFAGRWSR